MKYMNETERKQIVMDSFNDFTFQYITDLSGEISVYPPENYSEESLSLAIAQLISTFMVQTYPRLNGFSGFANINFKIIK